MVLLKNSNKMWQLIHYIPELCPSLVALRVQHTISRHCTHLVLASRQAITSFSVTVPLHRKEISKVPEYHFINQPNLLHGNQTSSLRRRCFLESVVPCCGWTENYIGTTLMHKIKREGRACKGFYTKYL